MSAVDSDSPTASRRRRWAVWLRDGLILLTFYLAIQAWQLRDAPHGPAPGFSGTLIDGRPLSLTAWRAEHPATPGLVYFWADWCGICKGTAGNVRAVAHDWPVLSIATQSGDSAHIAATMAERDYPWPTLPDEQGTLLQRYGLPGVPAFAIVQPDGQLRFLSMGYTSELGLRLRLWLASLNL